MHRERFGEQGQGWCDSLMYLPLGQSLSGMRVTGAKLRIWETVTVQLGNRCEVRATSLSKTLSLSLDVTARPT